MIEFLASVIRNYDIKIILNIKKKIIILMTENIFDINNYSFLFDFKKSIFVFR